MLDPVGGPGLSANYRMLAPFGRLIMYGMSSLVAGGRRKLWHTLSTLARTPRFKPLTLINDNRGVFGLNLGHLWTEQRLLGQAMQAVLDDCGSGRLRPVVARTFPLAEAAAAHQFLHDRANIGKVILTP